MSSRYSCPRLSQSYPKCTWRRKALRWSFFLVSTYSPSLYSSCFINPRGSSTAFRCVCRVSLLGVVALARCCRSARLWLDYRQDSPLSALIPQRSRVKPLAQCSHTPGKNGRLRTSPLFLQNKSDPPHPQPHSFLPCLDAKHLFTWVALRTLLRNKEARRSPGCPRDCMKN